MGILKTKTVQKVEYVPQVITYAFPNEIKTEKKSIECKTLFVRDIDQQGVLKTDTSFATIAPGNNNNTNIFNFSHILDLDIDIHNFIRAELICEGNVCDIFLSTANNHSPENIGYQTNIYYGYDRYTCAKFAFVFNGGRLSKIAYELYPIHENNREVFLKIIYFKEVD